MKTSLVVLAAGMGSRFGGLKQLQPLTADGKVLLDYSIDDALSVGFDEVVFIIRKETEEIFKSTLGIRTEQKCPVKYVYQEHDIEGRTKPLGTCHAILCCKHVVQNNFAVINADDYYGLGALRSIYEYLSTNQSENAAMVAYQLGNTVSSNGTVTRGVCAISNGLLQTIHEVKGIDGSCKVGENQLDSNTAVSMNLWAFRPSIFTLLQQEFDKFLQGCDLLKDEVILSTVINDLIASNKLKVQVFDTDEKWVGMTYRQDLPIVREFLQNLKR
jgi:NDP-sugar pyrophosphorylase family protein